MGPTSIEFGIGTLREEVAWLQPVVEGWHVAIEETCTVLEKDKQNEPPYASTEQAGVSFLVAGAWKAGMVAAAELSVVKSGFDGEQRNGRTDLLISDRAGTHMADFEAKCKFIQPGTAWTAHEGALGFAVSEAKRNLLRTNIGVCFYPLFVSVHWENAESGGMNAILEKEVRNSASLHADLLAWSFPAVMRNRRSNGGNRDYWPGLFIAMKLAA